MKVLIIGGSGLLGSCAAFELIGKGHSVKSLSLPPLPKGAAFPEGLEHIFGDYTKMSDEELLFTLSACDSLVFASGVDERVHVKPPALAFYQKYNNAPLHRILGLAKLAGLSRAVVLGSYFCHFNRTMPEMELEKWHPYIKSRVEQEGIALRAAEPGFDVAVLELPYIFGAQSGRKPVWVFLVDMLRKMRPASFYPRGGTAMVTARQVGQAVAGALERNRGGVCYPIGWENRSWRQLLAAFHKGMGCPEKRIVTIPTWLFRLGTYYLRWKDRRKGLEGGLNLPRFASMMASEAYIDRKLGCLPLGVTEDDLDAAIASSVRLSVEALTNQPGLIDMPTK